MNQKHVKFEGSSLNKDLDFFGLTKGNVYPLNINVKGEASVIDDTGGSLKIRPLTLKNFFKAFVLE